MAEIFRLCIFVSSVFVFDVDRNHVKCYELEGVCDKDQNCYKDYNNNDMLYFEKIEMAEKSYVKCTKQKCSCVSESIASDLSPFQNGITKDMIIEAKNRGAHYQILNHTLYRQEKCIFPFRCSGVEHFIKAAINDIPDTEFILNNHDWPKIQKNTKILPVFSFSKDKNYMDILYPAWSFWEGGPAISLHPTGIGRWDLLTESISKAGKLIPWDQKEPVAFFRGSRTSSERDPLILLSRGDPNLVDAQYTKNQAWKSDADTLGASPAAEVSFENHCKYKYLFNFRGVAASFRFKHLFLCNSLVFHVGNDWTEFFYPALKPWIHYVPVSTGLSEVRELIEFFKRNDRVARKIASRGFDFISKHLTLDNVECYWRRLLRQYARLLRYKVEPDSNLKRI